MGRGKLFFLSYTGHLVLEILEKQRTEAGGRKLCAVNYILGSGETGGRGFGMRVGGTRVDIGLGSLLPSFTFTKASDENLA